MGRVLALAAGMAFAFLQFAAGAAWHGHAGNSQHTAVTPAPAQKLNRVRWTTPIDLNPQKTDGELNIHYGSPIVTAANTVILPVKTGKTGGFRVEAHNATTGAVIWTIGTRYRLPPHNLTPSYGPVLTRQNRLYFAGEGGVVRYRDNPDGATGPMGWHAFYGDAAYKANPSAYYTTVKISTPLTADAYGNVYFGFKITGTAPDGLVSGFARIGADGKGSWVSAATASGDPSINEVQTNCAPALSRDRKTVYIAVSTGPNNFNGYLLGLDATTLKTKYAVRIKDPATGGDAEFTDDSSASPTIAPNGDVFMGVVSATYPYHNGRGWLLHFDATLTKVKIPGSFGWDSTVSVLPASTVPSYSGKSNYLLMSKYNNYADTGNGDGHNEIAILDPTASQLDEYSSGKVRVMKEVMSIANPTPFPNGGPGETYEWCIDTAAVDPASNSVFANAEDGHLYRWNLKTNTFSEQIGLNPPQPEAYTPTVVGVDGTVYAINNATLYAIGQ